MKTQRHSPIQATQPILGSASWGRAKRGRMTRSEQCQYAVNTVLAQLRLQWQKRRSMSSAVEQKWGRLEPNRIQLPDTPTISRALALVEQSEPAWLRLHSLRTWAWAALLAQKDSLKPDFEVLAASSLLHDLALIAPDLPQTGPHCACFAIDGGQQAYRFLQGQGWAQAKAQSVEDAICLHMNPHVPLSLGTEAHLLQRAAALDVVGARMAEIDTASRQAVLARYPRTGFATEMSEAMRKQAQRGSDTRTHLLVRMGFERAIRQSAWQD